MASEDRLEPVPHIIGQGRLCLPSRCDRLLRYGGGLFLGLGTRCGHSLRLWSCGGRRTGDFSKGWCLGQRPRRCGCRCRTCGRRHCVYRWWYFQRRLGVRSHKVGRYDWLIVWQRRRRHRKLARHTLERRRRRQTIQDRNIVVAHNPPHKRVTPPNTCLECHAQCPHSYDAVTSPQASSSVWMAMVRASDWS